MSTTPDPSPDPAPAEAGPAPKKKRRWGRRLGILLVFLVVLVFASPHALAIPFVRDKIAEAASDALGRRVTIERTYAFWFKGIDVRGITVHSPDGFAEPLLTVDRVHVDLDLISLVRGTPDASVVIDAPRITFLQDAEGHSNLEGLLPEEG